MNTQQKIKSVSFEIESSRTKIARNNHHIKSSEQKIRNAKKSNERLTDFLSDKNSELAELKELQFQRYLHTPCYKYKVND